MAGRVLIADDYSDGRESLAALLALNGYTVEQAATGDEAVNVASWFRPDVAIVDLALPTLDGFAVAQELTGRSDQRPYLIALTGHAGEAWKRKAYDAGFDFFAVKPWDCDAMFALLELTGVMRRRTTAR